MTKIHEDDDTAQAGCSVRGIRTFRVTVAKMNSKICV
jgi:hypothetical protein